LANNYVVPAPTRRPSLTVSVDVVTLVVREGTLGVAVVPAGEGARERWMLPWGALAAGEAPEERARRVAHELLGRTPALVTQVGVLGSAKRHPGDAQLSIGCVALVAAGAADALAADARWVGATPAPAIGPRHRLVLAEALGALRRRIGDEPLAFRLLPPAFTLSELQGVYETILGRALHKASFRRTLHAAEVVEPTDEWRSEGRGRPAQLFRFVPGNPGADRHLVRFDFGD
jgi:8-oxo-dGTP diphosphatase